MSCKTSEITHIIEGHAYYVVGVAWNPDGTRLVAVGSSASPHDGVEFIDVDPLLLP